ncbi:MAG: molybdenum cofactor biosynthesis protein MoaE [Phycisphaera sp.]|nr:molybdenum cofactor biosynthesis protein MoaE [Phycisphaera sp.]
MTRMSADVHIIEGPLPAEPTPWTHAPGNGALILFEGIARPSEDGEPILALDYEAYEPMCSRQLQLLGDDIVAKHGLIALCVEHSTGRVGVGACSFRLRLASYHRKEGLAAMDEFIDRLKRDVPLWKTAVKA